MNDMVRLIYACEPIKNKNHEIRMCNISLFFVELMRITKWEDRYGKKIYRRSK